MPKIMKILLGLTLMAFLFYEYRYNITILIVGFVLIVWLEIFFNADKQHNIQEEKEARQCPCCNQKLTYFDMLKYALKNIITGENYFCCKRCKKLIINFKFYKLKIFIISSFVFVISLIFLVVFKYYISIGIAIILYIFAYIHGLTYAPLVCYLNKKEADDKDLTRIELKQEKKLFVLLFILVFLFFLLAILLKLIY